MSRTANSELLLRSAGPLEGIHTVPGDKSISHRAALVAGLARGRSTISNFASSRDCWSTVACLQALGVAARADGTGVVVDGAGREAFTQPATRLDAENSGTSIRLLAGVLAGCPLEVTLTGDDSL